MSNVYILEPPTSGKVLLKTTVGDIDVELWAKETPATCRNFIQLCLEGYYNNTIFHRVVKGFIVQGGDPNGDGTGGESIYGEPFKDEFHQRLRFSRRGLLAMANAGKDDNGSQFFFTLGPTPELQDKHTLFGKITGDTVFNMLRLAEGLTEDERPVYPHKILKVEVLNNPFSDIVPRAKAVETRVKRKKEKKPGVKNFKLLSFGAEAEEDEEESTRLNEQFAGKGKSTHDVLDDPKLSSETPEIASKNKNSDDEIDDEKQAELETELELENIRKKLKKDHRRNLNVNFNDDQELSEKTQEIPAKNEHSGGEEETDEKQPDMNPEVQLERIRQKLQKGHKRHAPVPTTSTAEPLDTYEAILEEERLEKKKKKYDEIKQEIDSVKKEYHKNKLKKEEEKKEDKKQEDKNETIREYQDEFHKYKSKKNALPKKGAGREQFTLKLLEKFSRKIECAKQKGGEEGSSNKETEDVVLDENDDWMVHRLSFQEKTPILAKDANKKDDDWFEIYDPRSALNKRRRGEDINKFTKK